MSDAGTTQVVQGYLDELGRMPADGPVEPVVRDLLARAVDRLHAQCAGLLYRQYPRLTRGPLNLQSEEMLGAVVERLIKAMRSTRPAGVRQFFALANQHMRWELNDLARRLDRQQATVVALSDSVADGQAGVPGSGDTGGTGGPSGCDATRRLLDAIEGLPDDEREAFDLVRVQGMSHAEAADVVGVSTKTIQRRLSRCVMLLTDRLGDLVPPSAAHRPPAGSNAAAADA
ncbi:MAG TPA: sigma-70 family RNA polymerase sigma factor [Humisphaera sp.]